MSLQKVAVQRYGVSAEGCDSVVRWCSKRLRFGFDLVEQQKRYGSLVSLQKVAVRRYGVAAEGGGSVVRWCSKRL